MLEFHFWFIVLCLVKTSSGVVAQITPELVLPNNLHGTVSVNISGITSLHDKIPDADLLAVFVKNETEEYTSNAIQGRYEKTGSYLHFKPYFPFESGMTYVVKTRRPHSDSLYFYQSFQIGTKHAAEEAKVMSIYPSASQLPENILRFYIYFNTPMRQGEAIEHIQLIDAAGNVDEHAFMEFKQELWSPDGKRLTILFDPGRIKRGVSTNLSRGPALIEGNRYELRVSSAWQDVYGQQLSVSITKEIEVVNAYRHHMKVSEWVIDEPSANSLDPLIIHFDRILDHALVQSMIQLLEDGGKNLVKGHWEILAEEQLIQFIPAEQWNRGHYCIIIDNRLEDIAGNNLQNLLDHLETEKESNRDLYQQVIEFRL